MDHQEIRQFAELMKEFELTALEVSEGTSLVRLERAGRQTAMPVFKNQVTEQLAPQSGASKDSHTITSPTIGVFYAAPSPDMKPYISVGDAVHVGDVLCVIEAMKIMNEITSEVSGVVTEVCVGNKQIVEYGHPLFRISRE